MKDIPGFEGRYAITSCGKVWSHLREKFLNLREDKYGYLRVGLYKDGKQQTFLVHRLVALTYIPNPKNLPLTNHKDENKKNNSVNNLEWCDQWYNLTYSRNREKALSKGVDFKIMKKETKETKENKNNGTGVPKRVRCIETGQIFESGAEAARQLGVDPSHLSKVCRGKQKSTHGYHFEFVEEVV